jgi:hypothetical protein
MSMSVVKQKTHQMFAYFLGTFSLASPELTVRGDTELIADIRAQVVVGGW